MRFVLCDEDRLVCSMLDTILTSHGHEVVGLADTTVDATSLMEGARPEVAIIDLSLGYNTDFDMIQTAIDVGAKAVIFSYYADSAILDRYVPRPDFVPKPDFAALEEVIRRLPAKGAAATAAQERRREPSRVAAGAPPTGPTDARAFYEALNEATAGDAVVSIDLPESEPGVTGVELVGLVTPYARQTDRLFGSSSSMRAFLPGAGEEGTTAFVDRLRQDGRMPGHARIRSVIIEPGESGADAFERLKHAGDAPITQAR